MATQASRGPAGKATGKLGTALLKHELRNLAGAMLERRLSSLTEKLTAMSGRLTDYADGNGKSLIGAVTGSGGKGGKLGGLTSLLATGAKAAFKGALGKAGKGGGKQKVTNIVESIDVGAPLRIAYHQWTEFRDFPSYMKKVESVQQKSDEKLNWKAQVFWSHRTWESHILEQVPYDRIIWRSKGAKGHVDGAVTFHELAPNLTRILVVLEYHPQGFFEHVGNIWRAQGRRARLELKHFERNLMIKTMLHPEEMAENGWRGEIHDGEVVKDHETALREEKEKTPRTEKAEREEPEEVEEEAYEEAEGGEPEEPEKAKEAKARKTTRVEEEHRPPRQRGRSEAEDDRPARRPVRRRTVSTRGT
ncbi:SRPBCC family protein [Rhizohabitans arisaemae]|uniref:SRPBCC family protein n=1 Tax=Rhizohabitans arisaemae TaxID=2720610 RepID=UPI0024B153E0|nr:SRPBCC family protein [Rhizohabitans arisaemae]